MTTGSMGKDQATERVVLRMISSSLTKDRIRPSKDLDLAKDLATEVTAFSTFLQHLKISLGFLTISESGKLEMSKGLSDNYFYGRKSFHITLS